MPFSDRPNASQPKPVVTIRCLNGLNLADCVRDIFPALQHEFTFAESSTPQMCISGPYGGERPVAGALHVGYLCENIWPPAADYDWCFGTWSEQTVAHPRYTRITWHGFDPRTLIKTPALVSEWLQRQRKFCNFIYSNPVALRESFCRELARYCPIDCPGRSLRNMAPIDDDHGTQKWTRKRDFLASYRFTIAFENSSAPGYHTEKILDPMVAGSIPIYWGNPEIAQHFNPRSFIHARDFMSAPSRHLDHLLRRLGRRTLQDYRPALYHRPADRARRRLHRLATETADWLWRSRGWSQLVSAIRSVDENQERYAAMLAEPWLRDDGLPSRDPMIEQWRRLFSSCAQPLPL